MRSRMLLLGSNGQLGHDILRTHSETGESFDLYALTRNKLDLSSPQAVANVLGNLEFDTLVNCAAYTRVDEVEDNSALAFAVNAYAVQAMAQICASRQARFIHISTDYVFGGDTGRTQPFREDDPIAPVNIYGASKAMGETLASLACKNAVILRVASLFGTAGASGKGRNFVETIIGAGKEKGALRVVDDQTMSPTATADAARVVLRILASGCSPGVYHAVNDGAATWFEFAREIVRLAGIEAVVTPCASDEHPTRALRPRYSALDNARISAAFGGMPPWQEALERYLAAKGHRGPATAPRGRGEAPR